MAGLCPSAFTDEISGFAQLWKQSSFVFHPRGNVLEKSHLNQWIGRTCIGIG